MSNADIQKNECHDGVCKTDFKPGRIARESFQNLRTMAGGLIDKVKETLTGDSHDEIDTESIEQTGQKAHLAKMGAGTVKQHHLVEEDKHVSIHKSDIIDRFVSSSWNAETRTVGSVPSMQMVEPLKMMQVRQQASGNQMKPGRYNNPWRYDNRH